MDTGNVLEMEEDGPGDVVDVTVEPRLAVRNDSKVSDV